MLYVELLQGHAAGIGMIRKFYYMKLQRKRKNMYLQLYQTDIINEKCVIVL